MFLDGNDELEKIDPDVRHVPEVLEIRVEIYRGLKKWELMQTVAKKLTEYDAEEPTWPLAWAFATRRAESIEAAKTILMGAWHLHRKDAMISFNLACYECQMGKLERAKTMLRHAFELDSRMRLMALEDEDLRPLWDSL